MKKVAIIIIGDEILLGRVTDTNSGAIARAVDAAGAKVVSIATIGDRAEDIREAIENQLRIADVVFTTGGLGPTKDDITKRILNDIFGGSLVRDEKIVENIKEIFALKHLKLNQLTLDQALVPTSAQIIINKLGTAPIMCFEKNGKLLVAMPGVPRETEGMLPVVIDFLKDKSVFDKGVRHSSWLLTGVSESALAQYLEPFESTLPTGFKLAYLPDSPLITLRLDGNVDEESFETQESRLQTILSMCEPVTILSRGEKSLEQTVVERLVELGLTVATAESCTGGTIASMIASVPGASQVYNGSVVSYANQVKTNMLGVDAKTLAEEGAVSEPVVLQMSDGVSELMGTDCSVATSGIAGPGGGSPEKPVGTVWIAVKTPTCHKAFRYLFPGKRQDIVKRAARTALIMLLQALS